MTETEARRLLIKYTKATYRSDDMDRDEGEQEALGDAIRVMERAIDIADKHAILAAEHETLKRDLESAKDSLRTLEIEAGHLNGIIRAYRETSTPSGGQS